MWNTPFVKPALVIVPIVLVAALALQAQEGHSSSAQIAFIHPQRVLAEATDARADFERFKAQQQQKASELRARQRALQATAKQLAQATDAASRARLQQQQQQQRTELQAAAAQAQSELVAAQRQLQLDLQAKLRPVLDDLLKGRNVQVVLNADTSVVWGRPELDLTTEVVERLNAKPETGTPKQ